MSIPREGSRDTGDGLIISTCPDVCKTPVGASVVPIPYSIWAKQNQTAEDVATTVFQTSDRSHKLGSLVTTCHGDEPGSALGVKSGTVSDVCTPKTYAPEVRIEGKNAVRHDDEWWMNNRNTIGKLVYLKDTRVLSDADPPSLGVSPDKETQLAFDDTTGAYTGAQTATTPETGTGTGGALGAAGRLNTLLGLGAAGYGMGNMAGQYYFGDDAAAAIPLANQLRSGTTFPQASAIVNGSPFFMGSNATIDDANNLLSLKAGDLVDFRTMTPEQLEQLVKQPWPSPEQIQKNADKLKKRRQEEEENAKKKKQAATGNVRVSEEKKRDCKVGKYKDINGTCGEDGQAHHIVPDYTLRYGTRAQGAAGLLRIPSSDPSKFDAPPSFGDGPAICLQGQAGDDGSEHWEAHGVDVDIAQAGAKGSPAGTLPLGDVVKMSTNQVVKMRPECEAKIREAMARGFGNTDPNQLARSTTLKPVEGSPQYNALSTGMRTGGRY